MIPLSVQLLYFRLLNSTKTVAQWDMLSVISAFLVCLYMWYGLDRLSLCPREIWILLPQPPKNCNYSYEQWYMALTSYLITFYLHAVKSKEPDKNLVSFTLPFKSLRENWLILSMSYEFCFNICKETVHIKMLPRNTTWLIKLKIYY